MFSRQTTLTTAAIAANSFSGIAALVRFRPILPGMRKARVPASWLPMIGTMKTAGALGLALGLAGVPRIGAAAAAGLSGFFAVAIGFHLRAHDYSRQLALAAGFLALNTSVLAKEIAKEKDASARAPG